MGLSHLVTRRKSKLGTTRVITLVVGLILTGLNLKSLRLGTLSYTNADSASTTTTEAEPIVPRLVSNNVVVDSGKIENNTSSSNNNNSNNASLVYPNESAAIISFESARNPHPEERCAINLYGLPRAFKSLVLPALIQNVIRPNAAHNCDYFVHYFNLTQEGPGRSGHGGHLNPSEILSLEQHVQREAPPDQRRPEVVFLAEQEEDFWKNYDSLIKKTRNTRDGKGRRLYFPWKEKSYKYPVTVDNIIKMWHSIQSAWLLMERHATGHNVKYTRVAMLRSDVMFATPIDIYRLDNFRLDIDSNNNNDTNAGALFDRENRYAVVPAFAKYPVNDRLIYGPHAAVKIWATERFARLETHVQSILQHNRGYGMHSEIFLNHTIFPAIRQAGIEIHEHPHMCFFRARADESVWVSDCDHKAAETVAERMGPLEKKKELVERLLGRQCGNITGDSVKTIYCKLHE
jgi:hypothetical protein